MEWEKPFAQNSHKKVTSNPTQIYKKKKKNKQNNIPAENKTAETEIRKKIPFDIATRKIKYLGINLTKEEKDLFSENYTTMKKVIKEDTNKWKHVPCSWIEGK